MIDNYGLWKRHDALREEQEERYAKLNKFFDMAIEGIEQAVMMLDDDIDKAEDMLRDLVIRLEEER